MTAGDPVIRDAAVPADIETVRTLFVEYGESLNFSLCFQGFDEELASLPGSYAPPGGRLLLAEVAGDTAGIVGLRPAEMTGACEMKRLYLRPAFRGLGLGRRLAETVIAAAREAGYGKMVLDTVVETMSEAGALYRDLGFVEIPPYYGNPTPGARYYALDL